MNTPNRSSQFNVQSPCDFCHGIFEHERWCPTKDIQVSYAYQIAIDGSKITLGDALILHSLGVAWPECAYDLSFAVSSSSASKAQ